MNSSARPEAWIGIDVGGTNLKSALYQPGAADIADRPSDGRSLLVDSRETPTRDAGTRQVLTQIAGVVEEYRDGNRPIAGLGVSFPGSVNRLSGMTGTVPNLRGSWSGVQVRDILEALTGLPTSVVNDARAFTIAEARCGAGRHSRIVVGVTLGTGLGNGITVDGDILENAAGMSGGDLGHQVILAGGAPCPCGSQGCVETLASTSTLCREAGLPTVRAVFEAAGRGEPSAAAAVDNYIAHVALALANVHTLLCPDLYVIGGGIAAAGDQLLGPLTNAVRSQVRFDDPSNVHLAIAELGHTAGAFGAALLASTSGAARATADRLIAAQSP